MGKSAHTDCTAVVFCGGDHRRFERLAGVQPKTLLVVHGVPLLWRLLDCLVIAGLGRIVAATTPNLERQVGESIQAYSHPDEGVANIELTAYEEQRRGMLFGLRRVLEEAPGRRCLIALGDIFFRGDPVPGLLCHVDSEYDVLGCAPAPFDEELTSGGIVVRKGERVLAILERPVADPPAGAARWSGLALIDRATAIADLERLLEGRGEAPPPGDFFEFQRRGGRDFRVVAGPDFVNVNSPDHLLLASLYSRLEGDTGSPLTERLGEAAAALRLAIARTAAERDR